MSQIKIYICGCARNVASYLDDIFKNIETLSSFLDDYHIIIFYDTSEDNSLDILKSYQSKYLDKMTLLIGNKELTNIRTQNIAYARNQLLKKMQELQFPDFHYFIMMDMDDACSGNMNEGVFNYVIQQERNNTPLKWDALSFNRNPYYDIWALSIIPYSFSCYHYSQRNKIKNQMLQFLSTQLRNVHQQDPKRGLLSCISAFNGFAIYRVKKFSNIQYEWNVHKTLTIYPKQMVDQMSRIVFDKPILRHDDCEHRYFHIRAIQVHKARICISPHSLFV